MSKFVAVHDKPDHEDILHVTAKQRDFCYYYIIFDHNMVKAYLKAFPDANQKTAEVNSSQLLARPNISRIIDIYRKDMQVHLSCPHHVRLAEINSDIELARQMGKLTAVGSLHTVRERMLGNGKIHTFNLADGETMTDKINILHDAFRRGELSCDQYCAIMTVIKNCEVERLGEEVEKILQQLNDKLNSNKRKETR